MYTSETLSFLVEGAAEVADCLLLNVHDRMEWDGMITRIHLVKLTRTTAGLKRRGGNIYLARI